jgi:FkbM family methyltransferase
MIDYELINEKLSSGLKLRFDIGLSFNMPNASKWLSDDSNVYVIGIEPHPGNFKSCCSHLETHHAGDRCYLIEAAISDVDKSREQDFYGLSGDAGTSSLCRPIGRFENLVDRVYSVETISLASILDNIIYETIDVLKTDTQGNDLRVMKSAGEHLKNVDFIYAEYDESDDYENANTGEELDAYLEEMGFECYDRIYVPERNNKLVDCEYRNVNSTASKSGPRWNSN